MKLRRLPNEVTYLLDDVQASPRLIAHLTLVHDVAKTLIARIDLAWPDLPYDRHAVALGAAIHDIGKMVCPDELSQPGNAHEAAGEALLIERGFPKEIARFARTHAQWQAAVVPQLDDLLVALTDALWRGKRDAILEDALCQCIVMLTGNMRWQVYSALDDIAVEIASQGDERLAWQHGHSL